MRKLVGAAFGAVALCMVACTFNLRNAVVQGRAVQQTIDETIAPALASYNPKLKIGPSQCQPFFLISSGTMGTCSLPVNGVPLEIRVGSAEPPNQFKVDFGGAFFFDMPTVEKNIEGTLRQNYRIRAVARCGNPRERLAQPGTYWVCTVVGAPKVRSVKVKIAPKGGVFVFNVPGLKLASWTPSSLLHVHKSGKATLASGADVKAYIEQLQASDPNAHPGEAVVTCPHTIDLTGKKRGVCTAKILKLSTSQRIGVWIDDGVGFRVQPIDAVIDRRRIQRMAQDDLNRRLIDGGYAADAVVECEAGFVVVELPGTFDCKATAAGKRYKLVVSIDAQGVRWQGIPVDEGR